MDAAVFRQWVVSVGRRHAAACMTHVLCELLMRLRAVEPVEDHAFELALTQGDLADARGISNVHVNRVLQDPRNQGPISPCTRKSGRCWTGRSSRPQANLTRLNCTW
jgi:hypothetical protein